MITTIQFVPGAVAAGSNINLPAWAPKIDVVSSASLIRIPSAFAVASHAALAHSGTAVADHTTADATHAACAATSAAYPAATSLGTFVNSATHNITQPNNHPEQAHAISGADPIIGVTPVKVDEDTITLNVDTALGDILTLSYIPVGARVRV